MKPRLDRLEALRAFACIGVFSFHCYVSLLGTWAVSVFVMLSGFLLTYNGLDRVERFPTDFRGCAAYAWKKTRKMYPLYFFTLLVLALRIFLLAPENPDMNQVNIFIKQFILSVFLIQSWPPNTEWAFGFNGVGWYLSTCIILYFAFPAILRRVKNCGGIKAAFKRIAVIFAVMFLVAWLAAVLHRKLTGADFNASQNFQHWFTYVFPPFRLGDFSIGCLMGYIFTQADREKIGSGAATALEAAAIGLFILTQALFNTAKLPNFIDCNLLFIPSSAMLVYFFALGKGHISRFLDNGITRLIADYSVEIFLIHFAVIKYASPFSHLLPVPYIFQQVAFASFSVVLTALSCFIWRRIGRRFPALAVK